MGSDHRRRDAAQRGARSRGAHPDAVPVQSDEVQSVQDHFVHVVRRKGRYGLVSGGQRRTITGPERRQTRNCG
jgi:hypothetical protein